MIVDQSTVTRFGENLKNRGKQPATIESYCRDAQRFLDFLAIHKRPVHQVEPGTLVDYQSYLKHECQERDNSIRRAVIGVRQFFRFLVDIKYIKATPLDLVAIPSRDDSLPQGLDDDQVEMLFQVTSASRSDCKSTRDAALLALLAFEGLKATEIIALVWGDFLPSSGGASLAIGGSRARLIHLSDRTTALLKSYRNAYQALEHPKLDKGAAARIFIAFKGREAATPLPVMTRHGLKFILYEIGEKVDIMKLNTEQLRHFAVNHLIAEGRSPEEIMLHLGLKRLGNIAKHLAASPRSSGWPTSPKNPPRHGGRHDGR